MVGEPEPLAQGVLDLVDRALADSSLIWTTLRPTSWFEIVSISASASPSGASVSRTWSTVAARSSGAVIRVPHSKSIPKFSPWIAIAKAQINRIRPDIEKNHFDGR